jgi:hypothetical protein
MGVIGHCEDAGSDDFYHAIVDLVVRMGRGHELKEQGRTPKDGDPEFDQAIFGHTLGLGPDALLHFTMCHFMERIFAASFSKDESLEVRELASQKDMFLNAMGDLIKLNTTKALFKDESQLTKKEQGYLRIANIWGKSRVDGGVEWFSDEKKAMFAQVLKQEIDNKKFFLEK